MRVPGAERATQKLFWIPPARYRDGFLAAERHPAVGWQIPQPSVSDAAGTRVRLDDLVGGQWSVVHVGTPPAGAQAWSELGLPVIPIDEPTLVRWLRRKKASAVVVRPDGYIYAATDPGEPLAPPPSGFFGTVAAPNSTGAPA